VLLSGRFNALSPSLSLLDQPRPFLVSVARLARPLTRGGAALIALTVPDGFEVILWPSPGYSNCDRFECSGFALGFVRLRGAAPGPVALAVPSIVVCLGVGVVVCVLRPGYVRLCDSFDATS
jgi:hypothetical protein